MIEVMITLAILALLSAMTIPGWLAMVNRQRLGKAQDKISSVLRDAQANAKRQDASWQACFWDNGNQVVFAVQHVLSNGTTNCSQAVNWQPLIENQTDSRLMKINTLASNLNPIPNPLPSGYYEVQFTPKGLVDPTVSPNIGNPAAQKITIALRNQSNSPQSCIFVETLLGALRNDSGSNCNNNN